MPVPQRVTVDKPEIDVKILRLSKQLQDLEDKKEGLEDLMEMGDLFVNGEIILFEKRLSGKSYTYVAIKICGLWYITGNMEYNKRYNWQTLVDAYFQEGVEKVFRVTDVDEVAEVTAGIKDYKSSLLKPSPTLRRRY